MEKEYLLEFQQIGNVMKVTALDPQTGTEIILQGPANAGEAALSEAAIRKLEYVLKREEKNR